MLPANIAGSLPEHLRKWCRRVLALMAKLKDWRGVWGGFVAKVPRGLGFRVGTL